MEIFRDKEHRKFFHIDYLDEDSIQKVKYTDNHWGNDNELISHGLRLTEHEFNLLKEKGHLILDSNDRRVNVGVAKTILAQLLSNEKEERNHYEFI